MPYTPFVWVVLSSDWIFLRPMTMRYSVPRGNDVERSRLPNLWLSDDPEAPIYLTGTHRRPSNPGLSFVLPQPVRGLLLSVPWPGPGLESGGARTSTTRQRVPARPRRRSVRKLRSFCV